jgi:hypothetical protein
MNDSKFSFNAAVITIALSVIIAIGIIRDPSINKQLQEGAGSSSHEPHNVVVPLQKSFQLTSIAQEPKTLPIISSQQQPFHFTSLSHATTKRDSPLVLIRTQRSNITIFPQLTKNETHPYNFNEHKASHLNP